MPNDDWGNPLPNDADWNMPAPATPITPSTPVDAVPDAWGTDVQTVAVTTELKIFQHAGTFNTEQPKILIYGESGSGKTRLSSTFPDAIIADIDKGMSSVTVPVHSTPINKFDELVALHAYLKAGQHSYKTVVIDTLNEMQRIAMGATVEDFPSVKRAYNDLPSQSDYGKMLHDMMELTRDFINLPMRVVLLAQVVSQQFDTDVLQPQLIGKNTSREICRKMDVIGYIYKSQHEDPATKKKLSEISFDSSQYVTKDRSFKLPAVLLDPSFSRIQSFWG